MKKRKIAVLVLMCLFMVSISSVAYAAPEMEMIFSSKSSSVFITAESKISVSSGQIICHAINNLTDYYDTSITMELQRGVGATDWETLKTWSGSDYAARFELYGTYDFAPGLYRIKATHTANGDSIVSYTKQRYYD